jgi:periplasmic protein TonB
MQATSRSPALKEEASTGGAFPFEYYLHSIERRITGQWKVVSGGLWGESEAVVVFEVARDGRIKEPAVERSSGSASYDLLALRAVSQASPFPPLPAGYSGSALRVRFTFTTFTGSVAR